MDRKIAKERVLRKLADYASARKSDVAKGLETKELAGVLVQKYGYGLCDAFAEVFRDEAGPAPTYTDVDKAVGSIDPNWRRTQKLRWKSEADLASNDGAAALDLSNPRK